MNKILIVIILVICIDVESVRIRTQNNRMRRIRFVCDMSKYDNSSADILEFLWNEVFDRNNPEIRKDFCKYFIVKCNSNFDINFIFTSI